MDVGLIFIHLAYVLCVSIGIQWVAFVPAAIFKTEKFYDLTGSATFITLSFLSRYLFAKTEPNVVGTAGTIMCTLWAVRLGCFLAYRVTKSGHDTRFEKAKEDPKVFFVYWTIQGFWCYLSGLAVYATNVVGGPNSIYIGEGVGIGVWSLGFLIEVISDVQKLIFKNDPANKGRFISTGLWSLSRHPNYFGEILLWVGMAVMTCCSALEWWVCLLNVVSPCFTTLLLVKVSGIPILERQADERWGGDPTYDEYVRHTKCLIPFIW